MDHRHQFPTFLRGQCPEDIYRKWLRGRAIAHVRRDRKRGFAKATVSDYKAAIHKAVEEGQGLDAYTGIPLRWPLLGQYDNVASKAGRTRYKHRLGDLPTVDHVGGTGARARFKICAWRTNDAKHDLPYDDFVALCRAVVTHSSRRESQRSLAPGSMSSRRTPAQFAAAIRRLPAEPPVANPCLWYRTQKEHWLGWLREYGGPGAYGRKVHDRDARFAYNHIVEPQMLLWLVKASAVPRNLERAARRAQSALARKSLIQQAAAIRKCVPWEVVERALWG